MMSWYKTFQINYSAEAGDLIVGLVDRCRMRVRKADVALADLASDLRGPFGLRRLRTLWRRDGLPVVLLNEWAELRRRAANWLTAHADWHEQQAKADRLLAQKLLLVAVSDRTGAAHSTSRPGPDLVGREDAEARQLAFAFDAEVRPLRLAA